MRVLVFIDDTTGRLMHFRVEIRGVWYNGRSKAESPFTRSHAVLEVWKSRPLGGFSRFRYRLRTQVLLRHV